MTRRVTSISVALCKVLLQVEYLRIDQALDRTHMAAYNSVQIPRNKRAGSLWFSVLFNLEKQ